MLSSKQSSVGFVHPPSCWPGTSNILCYNYLYFTFCMVSHIVRSVLWSQQSWPVGGGGGGGVWSMQWGLKILSAKHITFSPTTLQILGIIVWTSGFFSLDILVASLFLLLLIGYSLAILCLRYPLSCGKLYEHPFWIKGVHHLHWCPHSASCVGSNSMASTLHCCYVVLNTVVWTA